LSGKTSEQERAPCAIGYKKNRVVVLISREFHPYIEDGAILLKKIRVEAL
jgi:hypothetical protein